MGTPNKGRSGSFLRAGLIDEFSLALAPVADGTIGTPTVFEAAEGYGTRKAYAMVRVHEPINRFTRLVVSGS